MAGIIDYIWQSTFCLFFFYGIYWCFLKNEKVFTLTRIFILIAPILALLFPIIEIPVDFHKPSISLEQTYFYQVLSSQEAPEEIVGQFGLPEVTVSSTRLPLLWEFKDYFTVIYFTIVLLLSIRLCWQVMQLQMLLRKGWYETVYKLKDQYFLVPTFGLAPIFSFFNKLFWDDTETLTPEEKHQIIQHEVEHIRQGHTYDVIFFQVLSILFWFNPAIHLMRTALVDVHEYLADAKVLKKTTNKDEYKKLIIRIAFKGLDLPIGNYFIRSTTLKRILMMKKSPKINWFKLLMVLPLTGMLLALVSMKYEQPIYLDHKTTLSFTTIEQQLLKVQDSLEVGIKVKKLSDPIHYEFIRPLTEGKLVAQLGELEYEISNISNDDEYMKVMSLLTPLRLNSVIKKSYEGVYKPNEVDVEPKIEEGKWNRFLMQHTKMPEKESILGLSSPIEVEFIVDAYGNIQNPVIKRSFGGGLDAQLIAAIKHSDAPRWAPGEKNGKAVPVVVSTNIMLASSAIGYEENPSFHKSLTTLPGSINNKQTIKPAQAKRIITTDVFDVVENPPMPEGGMNVWMKYLADNLKYPEAAKRNNIEGTVYVKFQVSKTGEIKDVSVLRGIGGGADEEAIRLVKNSPIWKPGRQKGELVNVNMRLPIRFKLSDLEERKSTITLAENKVLSPEPYYLNIEVQNKEKQKIKTWDNKNVDLVEFNALLVTKLLSLEKAGISKDNIIIQIHGAADVKFGFINDLQLALKSKGLNKLSYAKYLAETEDYSSTENINVKLDHYDTNAIIEPLYVINGKVTERSALSDIKPKNIKNIDIIKGAEAKEKYGEQGKNGVVVFHLKSNP